MPGLVVPARRSYSTAEEDNSDDSVQTDTLQTPVPASPLRTSDDDVNNNNNNNNNNNDSSRRDKRRGSKRLRLSDAESNQDVESGLASLPTSSSQANAEPSRGHIKKKNPLGQRETENSPNGSGARSSTALAERSRQPRSEHQPGSIVRVTLKNFVTYTAVVFYPGPSLNMVIGPNGTGKSTLVCAICLGLGWGPGLLGRSKDIGEYVKHGCDEATIEIELKGARSSRNPVVKRTIKREGNHSKWSLNGSSSTLKQVQQLVQGFSIQIDNLCQFLPQDRVVAFAQLTPVELLASTQRAAAPPHMSEAHEELKRLRREQRENEKSRNGLKQNLTSLESRQATQQADVERMRQRSDALQTLKMLEKCRPRAFWALAKMKTQELQPKLRAVESQIKDLDHQSGPSQRAINDKQKHKVNIEKVVRQKQKLVEDVQKEIDKRKKDYDGIERSIEECRKKISAEKAGGKERKSEVARIMNQIKLYRNLLNQEPPDFDPAAFNERIRSKERDIRGLQAEVEQYRESIRNHTLQIEEKKRSIQRTTDDLERLQTQAGQQEKKLGEMSKDTYTAWQWVRDNKDKFDGPVFGPPLVECSVSDSKYVNQLEACLQRGEFLAFTCTSKSDFKKLQEQLYNRMNLAEITIRVSERPLDSYKAPVPEASLRALGLEGFAVDFLNGPDEVKAMLCAEARLHATGISSSEGGEQQYQSIQASNINNWVTPKSSYTVTRRREYGPDASSTRVRDVRPAVNWNNQPVDTTATHDMRDNVHGWESEINDMETNCENTRERLQRIHGQINEIEEEKNEILEEKNRQQKEFAQYNSLPSKLRTQEEQLAFAHETEAKVRERIGQLNEEQSGLAFRKAQAAIDYGKKTEKYCDLHTELIAAALTLIEAESDHDFLTARSHEYIQLKDRLKAELRHLKKQNDDYKSEGKRRIKEVEQAYQQDPEFREYCENLSDEARHRLPDELEAEIEAQKARLELLHEGNPGAIQEFEARASRIEALKGRVADLEATLSAQQAGIDEIRGRWEPELDSLISRISNAFSASFAKIDCAGAVSIYKDGEDGKDFEDWAIQIEVKFREHEKMSKLDSHRQSGGERAVSTIFYLMALQSLSRAPFRVVDEINQGMDPRNERKVHERLVDIACGISPDGEDDEAIPDLATSGSQYFLITPKLLTGLKYSPGMTVHCIASGDYMPADHSPLDFKALLGKVRQSIRGQ